MPKEYYLTYIGYLTKYFNKDPVLLCVSNEKWKIKYYLKNIRGLEKNEYEIREIVLDYDTAISMYEDYILQEYTEDILLLTNQDINFINHEIEVTLEEFDNYYEGLKSYCEIIKKIPKLKEDYNQLSLAENIMKKHLSKVKIISKLCNTILQDSPIFSKNILEYLKHIKYLQEDRELTELFYRKVNEDD